MKNSVKPYYEPGRYKCRISSQGFNEASTGTRQFWIKFRVLERVEPFDDSLEQHERTAYFAVTPKTADWVMDTLNLLGFQGSSFGGVDPRTKGFHNFIGDEVELSCSHENDQTQNIREVWAVRSVGRPLSQDKVHDLDRFLTKNKQQSTDANKKGIDPLSDVPPF